LKYFPRTKFLCFQILSPWKLAAISDIINSKNQLKRGSFNKVNPNQSLLAQLPQDTTRTHFLAQKLPALISSAQPEFLELSALFGLSIEMVMHLWQNIHTHNHITWEIERINKSLEQAILPLGK